MRAAFSKPRQGRKIVAQGASPGAENPHPVRRLTDTPLLKLCCSARHTRNHPGAQRATPPESGGELFKGLLS